MYKQVLTNILIRNIRIKVFLGHRIMQSETFELVMLLEIPVFSKRQKEANKDLMQERFCTWPYITLTFDLKIWFHITAHTLPIISLSLTLLGSKYVYKFISAFVLKWINCIILLRYNFTLKSCQSLGRIQQSSWWYLPDLCCINSDNKYAIKYNLSMYY